MMTGDIYTLLDLDPQNRPTVTDCGEFFTGIHNIICLPEERKFFSENPNRRSSLGFYGFMPGDSMRSAVKSLTDSDDDMITHTVTLKTAL